MGGNGRVKGSRFFNLKISWFSKSSNPKGFKQNERELTKPENWQAGPVVWSNDDRSKKFAILAKPFFLILPRLLSTEHLDIGDSKVAFHERGAQMLSIRDGRERLSSSNSV